MISCGYWNSERFTALGRGNKNRIRNLEPYQFRLQGSECSPTPGGPRAGCPILSRNTLCSGVFGLALPALSHTANLGSGPWGAIPPRVPGPPISYGCLDSPRGASVNSCSCEEERLKSSPGRSVVVCRIPSFILRGVQETHLVCVLITTRGLFTCGWVING